MIINFSDIAKSAAIIADNAAANIRRGALDAAEKEAELAAKQLAEIAKDMRPEAAQRLDDATMQEVKNLMMYANVIHKAKVFAATESGFWAVEDMLHGYSARIKALSTRL